MVNRRRTAAVHVAMDFDPVPDFLNYLPWLAAIVIAWLVVRGAARETRPRGTQYLCSGCLRAVPAASIHIIPSFNRQEDNYVTSFRCEKCWLRSLDETEQQLRGGTEDEAHRRKLVKFFERSGISGLSPEDLAGLLLILDDLRTKRRVLRLPV